MNPYQNSSVYMDLLQEIHADVAEDLGISLKRESEKATKILQTRGIAALNDWLEQKLSPFISGRLPKSVEYSGFNSYFELQRDELDRPIWVCTPRVYAHIRQLLYVFRKLEDAQCLESDQGSYDAWCKRQDEMQGPLSVQQSCILETLRSHLRILLPDDITPEDLIPDIGPGASFEKRRHCDRPDYSNGPFAFTGSQIEPLTKVSRFVCVPKNYKRKRLIFVEPSSQMLVQKGIQSWLHQQAKKYPWRIYSNLEDQNYQRQKLRKNGASTIDLSDASDWIDRRVMWSFLRERPYLRSLAFAYRSDRVVSDHRRINSFSTMGNATTFPLMTLLLTCVLMEAEHGIRVGFHGGVFGDDIVCDSVIFGSCCGILGQLGLKINMTKSFVGGPFVESCGIDLYRSIDVTPVKIKSLRTVELSCFDRLLSYTNSLFIAGYWRASDVVLSELLSRFPKTSFGPVGAPDCVWSHTALTYDGPYSRDYQRFTAWLPKREVADCQFSDSEANLQFWLAHGRRATGVE